MFFFFHFLTISFSYINAYIFQTYIYKYIYVYIYAESINQFLSLSAMQSPTLIKWVCDVRRTKKKMENYYAHNNYMRNTHTHTQIKENLNYNFSELVLGYDTMMMMKAKHNI